MGDGAGDVIEYVDRLDGVTAEQLDGFFVGWPDHPTPAQHLEILRRSHAAWLALHDGRCVGFVNAISDGVFYAFLPLLEVLPEYRGRGIGRELVRRMRGSLGGMYAVDLICDAELEPFYRALGFTRVTGMAVRNFENQRPAGGRCRDHDGTSRNGGRPVS